MPQHLGSSHPAIIVLDTWVSRRIRVHVLASPDGKTYSHHTYLEDALQVAHQNGWTEIVLYGYDKAFLIQLRSTSAAKEPYQWVKSQAHS